MLAGGMVIAAPSMVPEAAAAGKLFVSAENANFNNFFAGAQVVEIIVKDHNADETDEKQGEPTVKVNEFPIRMAQASDGYWYAYIAETTEVATATANANLNYGTQAAATGITFNSAITPYHTSAVIGQAPTLSNVQLDGTKTVDATDAGQIGATTSQWPFLQTLDFTIETFEIKLEQAGADEIVVLKHDNDDIDDYAGVVADRNAATNGAQVHLTITDQALNIDPTTEDIVAFKVTDGAEGVSFKAGVNTSDGTSNAINNSGQDNLYVAFSNGFDDNGKLVINYNTNTAKVSGTLTPVLVNDATLDDVHADDFLIFFETAENSGVFVNTDDDDDSNLEINSAAVRGTTATIDYNDSAQSIVVAHDFGTIDMDASSVGDEWNSGEEMTVRLIDQDLNLNTFKDEDLTVAGGTLVPSLQIGSPLSIKDGAIVTDNSGTSVTITDKGITDTANEVTPFSKIATVATSTFDVTDTQFSINTQITGAEWKAFKAYTTSGTTGLNFINFDVQNITTDVTHVAVGSAAGTSSTGVTCVANTAIAPVNAGSILEKNLHQLQL
jgi:hypothetical protein